ncbi:MAG: ribosome small subunit-dependent GTPase A [Anaerolineae bacterium]
MVRAQSGFYDVETPAGIVRAVLRGVLKKERREEGLVALGDVVRLEAVAAGEGARAVIVEILPRRSAMIRRAPGPRGAWAQDVIVSNIDQLIPVVAPREPPPHYHLLDRFLALAELDELESLVVLNKVDLGIGAEVADRMTTYEAAGYTVLHTSAKEGEGIDRLTEVLRDKVSALVGPSGVGKTSLLNAVEPGLARRVGRVSQAHHHGRHTTRVGELHTLAFGGRVADTPGLRELDLHDPDPGELEWAFAEFRRHLHKCRFYDCTHVHEPGCAVRAAVADGSISPERHASYVRLLEG